MWRQPSELYIFVTSARPDPYVNVVVHAVLEYPIDKINFIGIIEHQYESESVTTDAGSIAARTRQAIDDLADGRYGSATPQATIPASAAQPYKECVDRLRTIHVSSSTIKWQDLDAALQQFDKGALFDVTALRKNLLVDVVTLLLSQGGAAVWSFELIKSPPTYDENDLVHALTKDVDYKYRPMTESPHVERSRRRMVARSRTFYTLVWSTVIVSVPVTITQLFFQDSWAQSFINATATIVGISGWVLAWLERRR